MLIASMAAIWARRATLQQVVDSLLAQTLPPDKVLIHYSEDLGWSEPPTLRGHPSIDLVKVPNLGSCRKYLFALDTYRHTDDIIVLVDDDRVWHRGVFERLVGHAQDGSCAATTRGWSKWTTGVDANGAPTFHTRPILGTQVNQPTPVNVASSGWGTCFHTKDVTPTIFSEDLQAKYQIRYSDEVFLSAMLKPTICVVPTPSGFFRELPPLVDQWRSSETSAAKLKQLELLSYPV